MNIVEGGLFLFYISVVLGAVYWAYNGTVDVRQLLITVFSVMAAIGFWPFVRKGLFGMLFNRLSRHPPTASHDGD